MSTAANGQVAELLGLSLYEAEGLMKRHHVEAPYSLEDYELDRETLDRAVEVFGDAKRTFEAEHGPLPGRV